MGWSKEDIEFLKSHWLDGWDDPQIAPKIGKTAKAVSAKRVVLGLTKLHFPERPQPFGPRRGRGYGRRYSEEEDADILFRVDAGESIGHIAKRYDVNRRAMECKVDRLLEARADKKMRKKIEPSSRPCLCCGNNFVSMLPKSENRRCPPCTEAAARVGASFLTIY